MIYYWFYCNIFHNSLKYSIFFGYLRHSVISSFCRLSQETDLLHCPLESIIHVCLFTYFSGVKTPFSMIQDPFACFVLGLFCYNNCPSDYLLCVTKKSKISLVQSFPMASQIEASPLFTLIVLRPIGTWRCLNWPFGHGLFIGYLFKMDCGQRAGVFLPPKLSFVRRLLGARCTHACQAGCGAHVLQISRFISIGKFGQLRPSVASRPKEGGHDHCGWARGCSRNSKQLT